jgi:flagellar hook-associated protein 2
LLTTLATGSNVTYQVNGQPDTPISSSSRNVTISTGLSVQLNKVGTTQVTVAQSANGIASALSQFADTYNSVVAELAQNRGQAGGALSGQSMIYQLQDTLRSLAGFSSGTASVTSLADLGLSFDVSGNLTFDPSTFSQTASSSGGDLLKFIGDSQSGGFLQAANNLVTSITDPTTGLLTQASQIAASQISALTTKINDDQAQISQLQATLTAQMASADAAISSLQTQLTELTTLFATIQANERASG